MGANRNCLPCTIRFSFEKRFLSPTWIFPVSLATRTKINGIANNYKSFCSDSSNNRSLPFNNQNKQLQRQPLQSKENTDINKFKFNNPSPKPFARNIAHNVPTNSNLKQIADDNSGAPHFKVPLIYKLVPSNKKNITPTNPTPNSRFSKSTPNSKSTGRFSKSKKKGKHSTFPPFVIKKKPREILVPESTSPKMLSSVLGVKTVDIIKIMIKNGHQPKSCSDLIDSKVVDEIATKLGFVAKRREKVETVSKEKVETSKAKVSGETVNKEKVETLVAGGVKVAG